MPDPIILKKPLPIIENEINITGIKSFPKRYQILEQLSPSRKAVENVQKSMLMKIKGIKLIEVLNVKFEKNQGNKQPISIVNLRQ